MMGKIEDALRDEVLDIVRREVKAQLAPLTKELAELRRLAGQRPQPAASRPAVTAPSVVDAFAAPEEEVAKARMTPDAIRALRRRVGVSQSQLALIIGVTPGAVAQWELGMVKPQGRNRALLVGLRKSNKQDVAKLLEDRKAELMAGA